MEGHIPASDVKRLLAEKPDLSGFEARNHMGDEIS
ncbi:MAG: DUF411 domain-containing protein [Gammaproteobacteria bacterium]